MPSYAGLCTCLAILCISTVLLLTSSNQTEHRAVSVSPTLFNGRPFVMKIHDFHREKKTVVNANAVIELVQSGPLFATYTVDLVADQSSCTAKSKGISTVFEIGSVTSSLVSGTFGPMSNSKLNLSIADNLDLTGRDLCVVITNDRRLSNSVTDAAKANLVVRFDIRNQRHKGFKFLYDLTRRPVVMTLSFVVGFALVFVPLAAVSKLGMIDSMKVKKKESITSKLPLNRNEDRPKMSLIPEKDGIKEDVQPPYKVDSTSADAPPSQLSADTNKIDTEPIPDIIEDVPDQDEVNDDQEKCSVSNDTKLEHFTEESNAADQQRLNANEDEPVREDDVTEESDYLLI